MRCTDCAFVIHAPRTVEGQALWKIARRPGLATRAGLDGKIVGFDWSALLMLSRIEAIPDAVASHIFSHIEHNMIAGSDNG